MEKKQQQQKPKQNKKKKRNHCYKKECSRMSEPKQMLQMLQEQEGMHPNQMSLAIADKHH